MVRPIAHRFDGSVVSATRIIDWVLEQGGTARYSDPQPDSGPYKPPKPATIAIDIPDAKTLHCEPGQWVGVASKTEPPLFAVYDSASAHLEAFLHDQS